MAVLLTAEEDELFNFLLGSAAPQVLDAVTSGSTPDLVALDRLVAALDRLRRGIAEGRLQCSVEPSEADVEAARRLVDLVRAGAPKDEIVAVAQRVRELLTPRPQTPDEKRRASAEWASAIVDAEWAARIAIRAIVKGEQSDLAALEKLPDVLDVFRRGTRDGMRISDGRTPALTAADVDTTRRLVDLARAGAPKDELTAAACIVHRILNRPLDPARKRPREEHEREILDRLRARGVDLTDADMTDVRRFAALQVDDADDAIDVATESQEITRRLFRLTDS